MNQQTRILDFNNQSYFFTDIFIAEISPDHPVC
jgi:hypothetical protein